MKNLFSKVSLPVGLLVGIGTLLIIGILILVVYLQKQDVDFVQVSSGGENIVNENYAYESIIVYDSQAKEVSIVDKEPVLASTTKRIITMPEDTQIMEQILSQDGTLLSFTTLSGVKYLKLSESGTTGSGWYSRIAEAWLYDTVTGEIDRLFSGSDLSGDYTYPVPREFSPNKDFISFSAYQCWNCGGHLGETLVFSRDWQNRKEAIKNLGRTLDFKFVADSSYVYNEAVVDDRASCEVGICWKPGQLHTEVLR